MIRITEVSSPQNPIIKKITALQDKSRDRRKSGLFVLEGIRELDLALDAGYKVESLLFCPELFPPGKKEELIQNQGIPDHIIHVSLQIYRKIAYRGGTEGVMAIMQAGKHDLEDLSFNRKNPLVLVAEAPEKPGNIGALLRTADAAALDAVLIANPRTDLYNPNIIRSSVGCLFSVPVATGTTQQIIDFLKLQKLQIWCAALSASQPYHEVDLSVGGAIVVGTEADGLSEKWLSNSDSNIIIPMQGAIDSMNVSVSAAILIFEAMRQRGFPRV
ncbi:TrmH family RNA methyltransferase [Zeaxanthinibacter enoshimensis]|uniref:TrmH family RNA methyltransferase n=1 Tax=Zeaxanthinibacter enoshimensis TaxID=392009 RepID=UPI0035613597